MTVLFIVHFNLGFTIEGEIHMTADEKAYAVLIEPIVKELLAL